MTDKEKDILTQHKSNHISTEQAIFEIRDLLGVVNWVVFDFQKPETHPPKHGKYFVRRKDGKIHWETWNGSGWAYNGNVITHYKEVRPPSNLEKP